MVDNDWGKILDKIRSDTQNIQTKDSDKKPGFKQMILLENDQSIIFNTTTSKFSQDNELTQKEDEKKP